MAATIIQTGTSLQRLDDAGGATTLTLPAGVTLQTTVPPRWCVYNRSVVLVNTPSQPLVIDPAGTVRLLTPKPPRLAPILAAVSGGTLTGTYTSKVTFVTLDPYGNILSESEYSPVSNSQSVTAQFLGVTNADVSPDAITLRRFYRTTNGGAVYFQWVDLDGNTITMIQDDLADAGLSLFSAPLLGTPPRLVTIAEFRGRLWGSGDVAIDTLRYTQTGVPYAWPATNTLQIPGIGTDQFGIVGLLPRREVLGVGRRNLLAQITGTGAETAGVPDFNVVIVSRELGMKSQESMRVFRDTAYFLWEDGVYTWGPDGIICISDGTASGVGNVRSWFTTNSYFNRDLFPNAFAHIDLDTSTYRLFLASAGSTTIDSWVEYNVGAKTWFGPHKTGLFSPTSAFYRYNTAGRLIPIIGGPNSVFQDQDVRTDGQATPIAFDVVGKRHDGGVPDIEKYFGEISLFGSPLTSGVLRVASTTGALDASVVKSQYADMRLARQRLGRLGRGKHAQVELVNANVGEDVKVYGYEIDPMFIVGRR